MNVHVNDHDFPGAGSNLLLGRDHTSTVYVKILYRAMGVTREDGRHKQRHDQSRREESVERSSNQKICLNNSRNTALTD